MAPPHRRTTLSVMRACAPALLGLVFYASSSFADPPPVTRQLADPAMLGAGITSTAVGVLVMTFGVGALSAWDATRFCLGSSPCGGDTTMRDVGTALMVGGGVALLFGVPLIVAGGARRTTRLALAPAISPRSAGLELAFRF